MKVLVITNMYPNNTKPYFGVFVKEHIESLEKMGCTCDIVNIIPPKAGGTYANYFISYLKLLYRRLVKRYDVVYCQHAFCVLLARFALFRNLIYVNHEGEFFRRSSIERVKDFAVKSSQKIIFVNKDMYDHFNKVMPSKKYLFQPFGVNYSKFEFIEKEDARAILGLNSKHVLFFPADPAREEKGFNTLEKFTEEQRNYISTNDIAVLVGGSIEYNKMRLYFYASDLVVSCSNFESDGLVYKESIACGRKFISPNVGNANFYASYNDSYIYNSYDDFESLIKEHFEKEDSFSGKLERVIVDDFSVEVSSKNILNFLRS